MNPGPRDGEVSMNPNPDMAVGFTVPGEESQAIL